MDEYSSDVKIKGRKLFSEGKVKKEVNTQKRAHFKVIGESETHYVILDKQTGEYNCDCRFFTLRQKECSHIFACRISEENSKA